MTEKAGLRIVEFSIPKTKVLNANKKLHYHAYGNIARWLRAEGREVFANLNEGNNFDTPIFSRFTVRVLVFPPTRRRFDPPNLYQTVKHLLDGGTDTGIWEDDDWHHLEELSFRYGGDISGEKDTFKFVFVIEESTGDEGVPELATTGVDKECNERKREGNN